MSKILNMPQLNLAETAEAVAACVRAGRVPLVLGPPGIAKTALARAVAPVLGEIFGLTEYPAEVCVLSNYDAVDVGGLPMVVGDEPERRIFAAFKRAAERPCLLVLDEFFTTAPSVQGPAMRLVLERYAGEVPLHPQTRIICIANPPEQSPTGIQAAAALINRVVILLCRPDISEIALYFRDAQEADGALGAAARRTVLDEEAYQERKDGLMVEMSYVMETRPELVCFDPPEASITDGLPFSSPRALHAVCEVLAAATREADASPIVQALVEGAIGSAAGLTYLAVRRARLQLPKIEEIVANPDTAKVPGEDERDLQLAAISLIVQASHKDSGAAWVYLDRFPDEFVMSISKPMTRVGRYPTSSAWSTIGKQIMMDNIAWGLEMAKGNIKDRPRRKVGRGKAA